MCVCVSLSLHRTASNRHVCLCALDGEGRRAASSHRRRRATRLAAAQPAWSVALTSLALSRSLRARPRPSPRLGCSPRRPSLPLSSLPSSPLRRPPHLRAQCPSPSLPMRRQWRVQGSHKMVTGTHEQRGSARAGEAAVGSGRGPRWGGSGRGRRGRRRSGACTRADKLDHRREACDRLHEGSTSRQTTAALTPLDSQPATGHHRQPRVARLDLPRDDPRRPHLPLVVAGPGRTP